VTTAIRAERLGKKFARRAAEPLTLQSLLDGSRLVRRPKEAFWALRETSIDLRRGEMIGVIGQNGSGKSTLLRLLGGVMKPDEGSVTTAGTVDGILELNAGMHPDLTGRENIIVGGVIDGLSRRHVKERVDEIVAFAELEEFVDAPVRTYSSGMKLRLGFSVAVHVDPEILLIDEVLAVGDMAFQKKCLDRIRAFKARGCAIVLISHDMSQINEMCDRAFWLSHGRVLAQGVPTEVVRASKTAMRDETGRRTPADGPEATTSQGRTLRLNENRFGSQEAVIVSVALLDDTGNSTDTISCGEPLTVRATISAVARLEDYHVSVSIADQAETPCFDINTDVDGVAVPPLVDRTELSLRIDRLDLAPGRYTLSMGLYPKNWAYAFDYHSAVYMLNVTGERNVNGILAPPRRWRLLG